MNTQNYNSAIQLLIHLIVMNNPGGVALAIKNVGYDSRNYISESELEKVLLQLYMADKESFFQVMKNVKWNYGHKATNRPEIKDQLIALTGYADDPAAKGAWWEIVLSLVQTVIAPPPGNAPAPPPVQQTNTAALIGLAIVVVGIIIGIVVIIRLK